MVVDLVRASNDKGILGSMSKRRNLNVLLSRQRQAVVIFGDKDCVKSLDPGEEKFMQDAKSHKYNDRYVMKMFEWMQEKGRLVQVPAESLSQEYVKLESI